MFLLVAQRPEFVARWRPALEPRGSVRIADSLPHLQACLQDSDPTLVVIDRFLLGALNPAFLGLLKKLCGNASLVLGNSNLAAPDELLALAAGVSACCPVVTNREEIERVVTIVLDGGFWLSAAARPELARRVQVLPAESPPSTAAEAGYRSLTERQREVAERVARGESNKTIARQLDITERTVKAHLTAIFERLGFTDRLQLALYVTRRTADDS